MFFLLSTNSLQKSFQFSFPTTLDVSTYQQARARIRSGSAICSPSHDAYVFVTSRFIEGNLFWDNEGQIGEVTTAKWDRYFSPPSVFEYLFHSILCIAICAFVHNIQTHREYTIGCQFDYARLKEHVRTGIALGHLCDQHLSQIRDQLGEVVLQDVLMLFSFSWLGNTDDRASVAGKMLDYFRFDLKRHSGYKRRFWERVQSNIDTLWFDIIKEIFKGIVLIVIAYLLFKFGLQKP
jgi:hypothetical protein